MKCPMCPVFAPSSCLGEAVDRLCGLAGTRPDYRRQLIRLADEVPAPLDALPLDLDVVLARVFRCPNRGAVLPPEIQTACGCGELTECRLGRGASPGRVTLQDCLACVAANRD